MRVISILAGIMLLLSSQQLISQGLQLEPMGGHRGIYYQQVIGLEIDNQTKLGILNISSVSARYAKFKDPEIMGQVYITRPIFNGYGFGLGGIYVRGAGLRPSAMLNILKTAKNLSIIIFPRVDLWKNPSMELMTIMEYRPEISSNLAVYSRIQLQTIWDKNHHLKSSQHVRFGLDIGGIQFGLAVALDEYGGEFSTFHNVGVFIRCEVSNFQKRRDSG